MILRADIAFPRCNTLLFRWIKNVVALGSFVSFINLLPTSWIKSRDWGAKTPNVSIPTGLKKYWSTKCSYFCSFKFPLEIAAASDELAEDRKWIGSKVSYEVLVCDCILVLMKTLIVGDLLAMLLISILVFCFFFGVLKVSYYNFHRRFIFRVFWFATYMENLENIAIRSCYFLDILPDFSPL